MQMPFCDQCDVARECVQDLSLFKEITGNKRVPPESFCKEQYARAGIEMGDFYRNVMVDAVENTDSLIPVFPELKAMLEQVESEQYEAYEQRCRENGLPIVAEKKQEKLPLSITLMLTEKCNLACEYCYERFSGNIKPKSMSRETIQKAVSTYLNKDMLERHSRIQWDLIGGEIFVDLEQVQFAVQCILNGYRELQVCPKTIAISLCSNGTNFTPEVRAWLEWLKGVVGGLELGLSLDGVKECHDMCRNNSFDRVMEGFDWWRTTFPESAIKGTISPKTLKYLAENVRFYVEELKLPRFYINPTFEGPWTDEDAALFGEELIKCAQFFMDRQDYQVLENSNLFMRTDLVFNTPRKGNWCGCGVYMRAFSPDGVMFPCLRAVTSDVSPIGTLECGEQREKLLPFYLYTQHNEDTECRECDIRSYCPSCVMQWVEDTGDMFYRSKSLCTMTRVRYQVSKWHYEHSEAGKSPQQGISAQTGGGVHDNVE